MPRYFFHVQHHASEPDTEGTEFADLAAAQAAALRLCGEMIQEMDGRFWQTPLWQLQVTNQDQRLLFTLTFSAEDTASI
jgi:hypothetical protein